MHREYDHSDADDFKHGVSGVHFPPERRVTIEPQKAIMTYEYEDF